MSMKQNHTSSTLSLLLFKHKFIKKSKYCYIIDNQTSRIEFIKSPGDITLFSSDAYSYYPAYDILNDLCVKHAKEMFGEKEDSKHKLFMKIGESEYPDTNWTMLNYHSISILVLLQQNKKEEAEEYLWTNSIINPNNKNI